MTLEELRDRPLEEKVDYICDYVISHGLGPKFRNISFRGVIVEYKDIFDAVREVNRSLRPAEYHTDWYRLGANAFKNELVKGVLNHELIFPRIKEEISKL